MKADFRRKFAQFASFVITNREVGNFFTGKIYKGNEKYLCAPGLNCYSCPAATLSCPLGAMQTIIGSAGSVFGFYAFGFILMFGVLCGRFICGFLCPFGLFQELLAKIPLPKKKLPQILNYVKYAVLFIFVLLLPLAGALASGIGEPAFCQYICPAGTLEAAIPLLITHSEFMDSVGVLFAVKLTVLLIVIIGCMTVYRFFCKTLCPLGALYGLLNKISFYRMGFNKQACVNCGACEKICPMGINPAKSANSTECIRCGKCVETCGVNALNMVMKLR
ncbi:MAG: 4Fe-4S binding protein [Selenomonadaceae bacterium]|nr:4Fe-4S binding protein [Selenomonadaceae bacterium]